MQSRLTINDKKMRRTLKLLLIICIAVLCVLFSHFLIEMSTSTSLLKMKYRSRDSVPGADSGVVDNSRAPQIVSSEMDLPNKKGDSDTNLLIKRFPKCLIIGFSKCGTTALRDFLSLHPDVVTADHEVVFFSDYFDKGLTWYLDQMPPSLESQITIEKTPNYILSTAAHERIRAFNASIRLIIIVRDPIVRIQSSFAHAQAKYRNDFKTPFKVFALNSIPRIVNYASHIENLYRTFSRNQVLVITEEKLEDEPFSVMKDIEAFLGLRSAFTDDNFVFDPAKGFYCFNITHPKYQEVGRILNIDERTGCFKANKGRAHHDISPSLLRQLVLKVKPYNERLFALLGKKFDWIDEGDIQI